MSVEVKTGSANFLNFDEASLLLSVTEGVTSNTDEGIYVIEIKLTDEETGVQSTTKISLTLLPVNEV